jgi:hypothetical protein
MLPAIGAASSAIDALKALLSSKSSSAQSTGSPQDGGSPFDYPALAQAKPGASVSPGSGGSGVAQISPATMSALLAAQGQASTSSTGKKSTI